MELLVLQSPNTELPVRAAIAEELNTDELYCRDQLGKP